MGVNLLQMRRLMLIASQPHLDAQTGSLLTWDKCAGEPLKSCMLTFGPVQEGTGDPSPSNVRPISGRTLAKVYVSPTTDPDDGTTNSIAFPSEAGTVYGGTLDVTNGTLTADMALLTFDGSEDEHWHDDGSYVSVAYKYLSPAPAKSQYIEAGTMFSNMGKPGSQQTGVTPGTVTITWTGSLAVNLYTAMGVSDFAGFLAYLAQHPLQVAYQLATPITVQLTPQDIATLSGTTNLWSDADTITASAWTY